MAWINQTELRDVLFWLAGPAPTVGRQRLNLQSDQVLEEADRFERLQMSISI